MSQKYDIEDVARLAKLRLQLDEKSSMEDHFNRVIEAFENLSQVNTEGVSPMVTPHQVFPELRQDVVSQDLSAEKLMENAPDHKDSLFKVPPVV